MKTELQTIEITADSENNAEEFWFEFDYLFPVVSETIRSNGFAIVSPVEWDAIKSIKGFSEGPEYAKDALIEQEQNDENQG